MDGEERTAEAQQIVGMKLERARKQRGLSLAGAEQTTKIHSRHIEALERGDFDALPSPGWARNLLTLYSWHLNLDEEVMVREALGQPTTFTRKSSPSRRWPWAAAILGVIAVTIAIVYTMISAPGVFLGNEPQRVVITGVSGTGVPGEDNVLVAKIAEDDLGLLSFPRSTFTEIPGGHGDGDIGRAGELGGPDLTRRTVARLTGTEVPNYLAIAPNGVKEIVDVMGGVQVNVEQSVSGQASYEGPEITLDPGPQTLNGSQTLVYLQGADLQNEVARAGRQQDFLYEMFRQALDPRNVLSDPSTLNVVLEYSETNMSIVEVVQLVGLAKAAENSDVPVSRGTIAGREETLYSKQKNTQITYWVPDDEKLSSVVKETVK